MTTTNQVVDAAGYQTSGPAEGVARYDRAVDLLLRYDPGVLGAAEELATNDASMPMTQAFLVGAREAASTLDSLDGNEREAAHAAAIRAWLDGNWHGAAGILDGLLVQWPADILGLVMGHLLDFFTGDARNLRDRVGRSLPSFDPDEPREPPLYPSARGGVPYEANLPAPPPPPGDDEQAADLG